MLLLDSNVAKTSGTQVPSGSEAIFHVMYRKNLPNWLLRLHRKRAKSQPVQGTQPFLSVAFTNYKILGKQAVS